jgi:Flp pilus assembly protein TadD
MDSQTKKLKQSNNKTNQDIAEEMKNISSLINQGKFQEALKRITSYETQNPDDKTLQFNKLGFLVDIGFGLNDQSVIRQGLDIGEQNLVNLKDTKYKANIHYNLANGYLSLYGLAERKSGLEIIPQSENLQKAKLHFREALKLCDEFNFDFKKQIFVNYGNCLDTLGRGVEALYSYDNAIQIDKNFSMAIGNKAKALRFFADISGQYRGAIYLESYQAIKSIIDKQDLIAVGGLSAKKSFEDEMQKIQALFKDKIDLTKKLEHKKFSTTKLSEFEIFFLDFCVKEKLFLNFHIHNNQCESAITDPIFISLITKIEDNDTFYQLAKYINQIKEDYAIARLLLVQSQFKRADYDSISRRTTFVNTLDYSQFNLYFGLLKAAFKEAYNILDKIAVFINDYYNLGLSENKIYITKIWQKDKKIREEILKSKNISLYALYDIYQDFKSDHYKDIQNIRNVSTHRKLVIFDSMLTDWDKKDDKHNIGYDTMLSETINLLRLTKSAIIYLINFVTIEENKKRKNGLIAPMFVDTSQFL